MTFRYATLNDLDCVIRYINLIPIREHRKKIATITKEKLEKWHLMYHAFVVLAEDKGEVVGYALFYPVVDLYSVSPLMHIEDIFIDAPLRRKGYGREKTFRTGTAKGGTAGNRSSRKDPQTGGKEHRMKLTKDEQMLVLLYGDGTKAGLEKALTDMRETLQPDEAELMKMTDRLLKKLWHMTEPTFQKLVKE